MPALPVVPNVIRFRLFWHIGEDLAAVCRLYQQYSGTAPTSGQLSTLAAATITSYTTHLQGEFATDRILEEVSITDLTSATAAVGLATGAVAGTRAGDTLPASLAVLQSLHIARRFRGGHARIYWPAFTQSDMQDSQTWKAASVSAFSTAAAAFITDVEAAPWAGATILGGVSVSFYNGFTVHTGTTGRARNVSTPRSTALVDVVSSNTVQIGIASQRKRLLKLA